MPLPNFIKAILSLFDIFRKKPNRPPPNVPEDAMDNAKAKYGIERSDFLIAALGPPGVGKSSTINRLRNMTDNEANDEYGQAPAKTDISECTMIPSIYTHPDYPHLKFLDSRGFGTVGNPASRCLQDEALAVADCILIPYNERLLESAQQIAQWCVERRKPCVVVRTKTDDLVRDTVRQFRNENFDMHQATQHLRERTAEDLARAGLGNVPYFLIDNGIWSDAIHDHKHNFKPPSLSYDEYELTRFIAGIAKETRYTSEVQIASGLRALISSQVTRLQKRNSRIAQERKEALELNARIAQERRETQERRRIAAIAEQRKDEQDMERDRQHDALDILIFALPFYDGKPVITHYLRKKMQDLERQRQHDALHILMFALPFYHGKPEDQRCNLTALQELPFF
ncbi:g1065 [Coccomyxa elongata]